LKNNHRIIALQSTFGLLPVLLFKIVRSAENPCKALHENCLILPGINSMCAFLKREKDYFPAQLHNKDDDVSNTIS
jgi:hypothetical protein